MALHARATPAQAAKHHLTAKEQESAGPNMPSTRQALGRGPRRVHGQPDAWHTILAPGLACNV